MNDKNEANTENTWKAFGYEVEMYDGTSVILVDHKAFRGKYELIRNAVAVSRMLHTRIMVDILTNHASQDDFSISDLSIVFPGPRSDAKHPPVRAVAVFFSQSRALLPQVFFRVHSTHRALSSIFNFIFSIVLTRSFNRKGESQGRKKQMI